MAKSNISALRDMINKKAGSNLAYDLREVNPSAVADDDFISTGSRWLDSCICKGRMGGIIKKKINAIEGLESTGKSFLAAQIAGNAQKQGIDIVYFDSESALDPTFLQQAGCDLAKLLYVQATSCEFVFSTIEEILKSTEKPILFVWDSIALTPTEKIMEDNYDPQSSMAQKARVLSHGLQKLIIPIANKNCTLLVLNQLKTNISANKWEMLAEPYFAPGGKSLAFSYSLRIQLTRRKSKDSFVTNEAGFRIGNEVKAKVKKSRFGTEGRECFFRIMWGGDGRVGVMDEESWLEAIRQSERVVNKVGRLTLTMPDGKEFKFTESNYLTKLSEDPDFKQAVLDTMDDEQIVKFAQNTGKAAAFYNIDGDLDIESVPAVESANEEEA